MGYKQNNPLPMMKSAMKMMKAERKSGMHRDSAMYMNSPMYSGHSPMEMGYDTRSPMRKEESRELKDMPIVDIEKGKAKGDMKKGSPAKAAKPDYIDIDVEGGNKGDKSKTKPGKKDFEGKGSPAKKYDKVVLGGNKGDKSKTKPGKKDYEK